MITAEQFQRQAAEGHTRIPVVREVLSDLDTPLSVYLKLADGAYTYLFESVEGGERFGRYSSLACRRAACTAFAVTRWRSASTAKWSTPATSPTR